MTYLPAASEHQIQQMLINYMRMRGYYVQRLNSGRMAYEYKGRQKFMMLAEKGTPDIMAFKQRSFETIKGGKIPVLDLVFVEVKRPGKFATPVQEMKMQELAEYGARCIVAHSIEELQAFGI